MLQTAFDALSFEGLAPARVIEQQRSHYRVISPVGELTAQLSGRLAFAGEDQPVTGDWVAVSLREQEGSATIHHLLPRRTAFIRKVAGRQQTSQVVAANVDVVLIVTSLNSDLNLRRLERTLSLAWESGATPAIILTKADLCPDLETRLEQVASVAGEVGVHVVSALTGRGMAELAGLIPRGSTAVVLGSSGVGKSTLVNALAGQDLMATRAIRGSDERGQHTTSHRELLLLPNGGCILDTPGMRELGLWETDAGLSATFADIEELQTQCRFSNCTHDTEPGCAVQQAIADGRLDPGRWRNYAKLQREVQHQERKDSHRASVEKGKGRPKETSLSRRRKQDWEYE